MTTRNGHAEHPVAPFMWFLFGKSQRARTRAETGEIFRKSAAFLPEVNSVRSCFGIFSISLLVPVDFLPETKISTIRNLNSSEQLASVKC